MYTNRETLLEEIEQQYPDQKEGFERFLRRCESIVQEQQNRKTVPEQNKSYLEFINEYVTSDDIKDAFNLFCLWFGATPTETPAIQLAHIIVGVLEGGVFYPQGGMQAFSDHLADFYVQKGGKIIYKSMVGHHKTEHHLVLEFRWNPWSALEDEALSRLNHKMKDHPRLRDRCLD